MSELYMKILDALRKIIKPIILRMTVVFRSITVGLFFHRCYLHSLSVTLEIESYMRRI